ncbi:MAG: glycerophosphodiester phosphodiesterase, partial [Actinomycetales bacterium]|nr:glycerophosphodiester phosphodiesterase [Actinomycetales bacterium]
EQILTFDEVLEIQADENSRRPAGAKQLGVYVETKHPTYFANAGFDLNAMLLATLERFDLNREGAPIVIQSMESGNLRQIRPETPLPLVQLVPWLGAPFDFVSSGDPRTYQDLGTSSGLDFIAEYAQGVGVQKRHVIATDSNDRWTGETTFVAEAHERGLEVHVWTLRSENNFLPRNLRRGRKKSRHGRAFAEHLAYLEAGVDGMFSDVTSTAVRALNHWLDNQPAAK